MNVFDQLLRDLLHLKNLCYLDHKNVYPKFPNQDMPYYFHPLNIWCNKYPPQKIPLVVINYKAQIIFRVCYGNFFQTISNKMYLILMILVKSSF